MKYLLLFACIIVAFGTISGDEVVQRVASTFVISEEEAEKCMNKHAVTVEDVRAMGKVAAEKSDSGVDQDKLTKTGCLFQCIWEKQEWMSGTTLNMDKIRRIVDVHTKDAQIRETYYNILSKCSKQVEGMTNSCEVARDFSVCLLKDMPHSIIGGAHHGHH